ncbi:formylglycine-generating enzyme family protein [bacterium]|nr:formylglycine-generating enzyme family protein [bacterium]
MKSLAAITGLSFVIASFALGNVVSNVKCTQRWPWNGKVDIDYTLTSENTGTMSKFLLSFYGQIGDGSSFPLKTLSGEGADHIVVGTGTRRVTWDAYSDLGATVDAADVKVAIVARETILPPTYMVLDLNTYEMSNSYVDPSPDDLATKRTQIWFRRVEAGTFMMGSSTEDKEYFRFSSNNEDQHLVTISKPFYIAIYETTEAQFRKIDSETVVTSTKPITGNDYSDIRGENVGTNWPAMGYAVDSGSFLGKLRSKTGHRYVFDLPTEAQWELSCRSNGDGTFIGDLQWNDGSSYSKIDDDKTKDANLNELAWYKNHESTIHNVGLLKPNKIGLYDMHGNVWEWCLDWMKDKLGTSSVTDPTGPLHQISSKLLRIRRGGANGNEPMDCRMARRNSAMAGSTHADYGFRMVIIEQ